MNNKHEDGRIVTYEPEHGAGSTIDLEVLEDLVRGALRLSAGSVALQRLRPDADGDQGLGAQRVAVVAERRRAPIRPPRWRPAARLVAAAGLVEGFGHVSARCADSGFAITSDGAARDRRRGLRSCS